MASSKQKQEDLKDRALDMLASVKSGMDYLQTLQEESLSAYLNQELGNEVDGRSKVLMSDATDTVEWMMPQLMRIFYTDKVIEVTPTGPEDEEKARLMSQKVNYDFMQGMNGYELLHDWFKDALIQKIGVVKYYWDTKTTYKKRKYSGLNENEYLELMSRVENETFLIDKESQNEIEVEAVDPMTGMSMYVLQPVFDIEGREVRVVSAPKAVNVPPEEFLFDMAAASLDKSDIVAHKKKVHKGYIKKKYKVKEDDLNDEYKRFKEDAIYEERFKDLGGSAFFCDPADKDHVYLYECYLNDYDEDGTPIPKKICIVGNKVIDVADNDYGRPPFELLTPIRVPHRAVGLSYVDLVLELRKIHTTLMRYIMDNIYYQNNGRTIWNPFRVNMKDVLDQNQPGGVVRTLYDVYPSSTHANITPAPMSQQVFAMAEQLEQIRESRTGVTRYIQGLQPGSLNKTATGITSIMNAAQQRIAMLAAMWAEGGVKRLIEAFIKMNIDYFDTTTAIKVNEKWLEISPEDIDGEFDITIDVGSGTGAAEMKVNQMIQMINTYGMINQMGAPIPAKYIYSIIREVWGAWGYKNPDLFAPANEDVAAQEMGEQAMQQQQIQMQLMAQQAQMMGGMNGGIGQTQGAMGQQGGPPSGFDGGGLPPQGFPPPQ